MALRLSVSKDRKPFKIGVQGALFTVLPLTRSQDREITEQHTDTTWVNGQEVKKVRDEVVNAKAKEVIKGWEGLEDEGGKPIPCTPESIDMLLELYPELILTAMAEARNIHAKRVEAAEKN